MRNDWFEIPLDEYVTDGRIQLGRGKVISKKDIQSNLGPYPIYSSSARQRGKFGEYGEYMFNEELITWSIDGGGKLFFRQKHKYSITNVTGFLRIHASELDYKFLYYLLSQQHALLKFDYSKKAHPSVIRKVYRVVHPSLSEQRKIAAILTSMDDTIEKSQAVIDQVQVVKRGLMHELFTRGLALESGSPREWDKEPIGNLFTLQLGKMLNKKARETLPRFPYLGNKDVRWGRFSFRKLRKMHFDDREREKFRLVPGDLLVCEGGEIGRAALWTGEFDCYYQKAVHRLRARDTGRVEPRFILHFMRFAAINGLLSDLASQSSIAHLTREKLALLEVPIPPLREQRKIADVLSAVDEFTKETEATMQQTQTAKRNLMSVLLTGELRVRPDTEAA